MRRRTTRLANGSRDHVAIQGRLAVLGALATSLGMRPQEVVTTVD
jgi:hypothetical protein